MARRLFFVPQVRNGAAELHGDDAKYLARVLRVERGHIYQISDNHSLYLAEVDAAHRETVSFRVLEKLEPPPQQRNVTLYAALIKFDHFEWMVEKATELGVARIVPVETVRSERGLEKAARKRIERWRKIALEAAQQSRRPFLPEVDEPVAFRDALASNADCRFFADEAGGGKLECAADQSAAVLIGPEGGWVDEERAAAANWKNVSLSRNVLRAETAALAALVLLSVER